MDLPTTRLEVSFWRRESYIGNNGAGISILSNGATGNLITSNSIYSNGGLGIDLGGNGVTSNDSGDSDTDQIAYRTIRFWVQSFPARICYYKRNFKQRNIKAYNFSSSPVNWLMAVVTEKAELSGFEYCYN